MSFWDFFKDADPHAALPDEDGVPQIVMDPASEGFVIRLEGPASLSAQTLDIQGRLQVFVRTGSQYSTWRQFPSAIQYEVQTPSGQTQCTEDLSMSISDALETYEAYSKQPSEQIVGESYRSNIFGSVGQFMEQPGVYRMRAHYEGSKSNWIEVEIAP